MATRGLLHHPLHARPPSYIAGSRYLLLRRSSSSSEGFSSTSFRRRLSTPTLRSVQCMKEDQAGGKVDTAQAPVESNDAGNTDVVEWVNKASPGPMVEVDPVTVFRRIIAERKASLALARQSNDMATTQSTAPLPFLLGGNWQGKSTIAVAVALIFLALAAISYFLRSKQKEVDLTKGKDNLDASTDGRRKLVKDTIKAPESVLTAMAIGAASVGKPKGHNGPSYETLHAANTVDTQRTEGADFKPIVNTTATDDVKVEGHGNPTSGQVSYNPSIVEGFGSFKTQNAGVDVTEGAWFAQATDDTKLESNIQSTSVVEEIEFEDVFPQRQELHFSEEAVVGKLVNEISVSEVRYETAPLNNVVDGEFLGEVVSVSVATEEMVEVSQSSPQVESFKLEEPEDDDVLADSSAILEKLEQIILQEPIPTLEGKNVVSEIEGPKQILIEPSNDQTDAMDLDTDASNTDSDFEDSESGEEREVKQLLTPLQADKVDALEARVGDINYEGQNTDSHDVEEHGDTLKLQTGKVEETVRIAPNHSDGGFANQPTYELQTACLTNEESRADAIVSLDQILQQNSASRTSEESLTDAIENLDQILQQNSGAIAHGSPADTAIQSLEEDPREENKKALEAAFPALAIGVGTVGTLFGVAGGLQVVGFAALASFLSQDFFWARSREELWQELNGITDRQKLLDFLARRNIVTKDQEESSL